MKIFLSLEVPAVLEEKECYDFPAGLSVLLRSVPLPLREQGLSPDPYLSNAVSIMLCV